MQISQVNSFRKKDLMRLVYKNQQFLVLVTFYIVDILNIISIMDIIL